METGGHLSGSLDQTIDETTDLYAFLFDQVAVEARADEFVAPRNRRRLARSSSLAASFVHPPRAHSDAIVGIRKD